MCVHGSEFHQSRNLINRRSPISISPPAPSRSPYLSCGKQRAEKGVTHSRRDRAACQATLIYLDESPKLSITITLQVYTYIHYKCLFYAIYLVNKSPWACSIYIYVFINYILQLTPNYRSKTAAGKCVLAGLYYIRYVMCRFRS